MATFVASPPATMHRAGARGRIDAPRRAAAAVARVGARTSACQAFAGSTARINGGARRGGRRKSVIVAVIDCPFCKEHESCRGICRNPQNVDGPLIHPSLDFTPEQAVRIQLDALMDNNNPRYNHGLSVFYEFCGDATAMERSRFFGLSKDIYQYDHFMSNVGGQVPGFLGLEGYEVQGIEERPDGRTTVLVDIQGRNGKSSGLWHFIMRPHDMGKYKDCYMTHRLLPEGSKWLDSPLI